MADTPQPRPTHVLEDPSAKAIARVYAQAFLNAAQESGQADALEEFTAFHDSVLQKHPNFGLLLTSQTIDTEDKLGILQRVVKPVASEFFTNFLKVLTKKGRLDLLPLILQEAWVEHEKRAGQRRVYIKSAVQLTEQQLDQITNRLRSALSAEPVLVPTIDEKLLGGLVVQVGDTVYDGSLRSRLKTLQQRLRERYLNEIQSGRDRFSHSEGN